MATNHHQSGGDRVVTDVQGKKSSLQLCLGLCGGHKKNPKNKRVMGF